MPLSHPNDIDPSATRPSSHPNDIEPSATRPSSHPNAMANFFAPHVFQAVLHDPATALRLKTFCEASACGENIAFLEKIDQYSDLLGQARKLLSEIHETYTSPNATDPINISEKIAKDLTVALDNTTNVALPAIEDIFLDARKHVEGLIREDVYPRFVTHQITSSAAMALSHDRDAYRGLGDCFCLTDPSIADNAIIAASDGFIKVTGYSRRDIVPRNCRFLQGPKTERSSVTRLRKSIDNGEETVELLLNYRKDGSPFWNLLHVAPLRDEAGNIAFYLGGQVDCSTTIHGNPDVMRVLEFDARKPLQPCHDDPVVKNGLGPTGSSSREQFRLSHIFKSSSRIPVIAKSGPGMEDGLMDSIGRMTLETQMEAFQTAYSKYLVLKVDDRANCTVAYYSSSAADLLHLSRARGVTEPIIHEGIFKILSERSPSSSSIFKAYKKTVTESLAHGTAVSVDLEVLVHERGQDSEPLWPMVKTEKRFVSHWTPCKDEEGRVKYVVLVFAERREM